VTKNFCGVFTNQQKLVLFINRVFYFDRPHRNVLDSDPAGQPSRTHPPPPSPQGSDPTTQIEALAKRCKKRLGAISMGQGQEPAAHALVAAGFTSGDCSGGGSVTGQLTFRKTTKNKTGNLVKPIVMSSQQKMVWLRGLSVRIGHSAQKKTMHFAYKVWFSSKVLIFAILAIRTVTEIRPVIIYVPSFLYQNPEIFLGCIVVCLH